jgi:hypothetical protein
MREPTLWGDTVLTAGITALVTIAVLWMVLG